jgi:hypothetical protein
MEAMPKSIKKPGYGQNAMQKRPKKIGKVTVALG